MRTQFFTRLRCNHVFALAALALTLPAALAQDAPTGPYKLPPLPYAPEALERAADALGQVPDGPRPGRRGAAPGGCGARRRAC